ncbi:MAG: hypothetical protein HC856_09925 [Pseudanabaena sp. RU_4_16]|nr:hypothetical protein [Pseudanabaena sp. RU_4_16]
MQGPSTMNVQNYLVLPIKYFQDIHNDFNKEINEYLEMIISEFDEGLYDGWDIQDFNQRYDHISNEIIDMSRHVDLAQVYWKDLLRFYQET